MTNLIRPDFTSKEFHVEQMRNLNVTILICVRNTFDLIRLCLSSIMQFYPEIPIVIMDGSDNGDRCQLYCHYMATKHRNIRWQQWIGRHSHGEMMNEGIRSRVTTDYVLTMDSDTIVMRGGWIEKMVNNMGTSYLRDTPPHSCGTLMEVSYSNQGCGGPKGAHDILLYNHPSCSIYDVKVYKKLEADFTDHGAPCWANMAAAQDQKYFILGFPIEHYVLHNCGSSWQEVPTIWQHDNEIMVRPFLSVVCHGDDASEIMNDKDDDFEVVLIGNVVKTEVSYYDRMNMKVHNFLYNIRFQVHGEYVCWLTEMDNISLDFLTHCKQKAIELNCPKEMLVEGVLLVERKHWQKNYSVV